MPQFKKKAATVLGEVRQELANTDKKIADLARRREAELLGAAADKVIDRIDAELASLQKSAGRLNDRMRLLATAAEEEETEAIVRRRQAMIERVAKKLAEADALADELQANILKNVALLRRIVALREETQPVFSLGDAHVNASINNHEGAALTAGSVRALLSFEFYRTSVDPFLGGAPGERRLVSLPGSVCPGMELQLQPDKIMPFADALRQASVFAVDLLRGKQSSIVVEPQPAPQPPTPTQSSTTPPATSPTNDAQSESRLAVLLKRQAELAADPAQEVEYMKVVNQIAELTAGA
jgi:hypothetical protein